MSNSPPAIASIGGQPSRCHARFSARTGMRRSTIRRFGSSVASVAGSRSFHELEKTVISSLPVRASALAT